MPELRVSCNGEPCRNSVGPDDQGQQYWQCTNQHCNLVLCSSCWDRNLSEQEKHARGAEGLWGLAFAGLLGLRDSGDVRMQKSKWRCPNCGFGEMYRLWPPTRFKPWSNS